MPADCCCAPSMQFYAPRRILYTAPFNGGNFELAGVTLDAFYACLIFRGAAGRSVSDIRNRIRRRSRRIEAPTGPDRRVLHLINIEISVMLVINGINYFPRRSNDRSFSLTSYSRQTTRSAGSEGRSAFGGVLRDVERLKEINRAPSLFRADGPQAGRNFMNRSRRFLNIPGGKSSRRIGVTRRSILRGPSPGAAIAISPEL